MSLVIMDGIITVIVIAACLLVSVAGIYLKMADPDTEAFALGFHLLVWGTGGLVVAVVYGILRIVVKLLGFPD